MFRRLDLVYSLDLSLESLSGKFKRKLKAYQVYGTLYIPVSVYLRITASKNMVEHLYEDVFFSVEQTGFLGQLRPN